MEDLIIIIICWIRPSLNVSHTNLFSMQPLFNYYQRKSIWSLTGKKGIEVKYTFFYYFFFHKNRTFCLILMVIFIIILSLLLFIDYLLITILGMVQVDPTIDPHRNEWSFGNINKYHYRTDGWRDVHLIFNRYVTSA